MKYLATIDFFRLMGLNTIIYKFVLDKASGLDKICDSRTFVFLGPYSIYSRYCSLCLRKSLSRSNLVWFPQRRLETGLRLV